MISSIQSTFSTLSGVLSAALVAVVCVVTPTTASAQSLAPTFTSPAPERSVVVMRPRAYADPTLDSRETGLGAVSLPAIRDALSDYLDADPSFVAWPVDPDSTLQRLSRTDTQADLFALARQATRLGISHYDLYDLASAIDELDGATQTWRRTVAEYTESDAVADAYLHLALALLERRELDPERTDADEARARNAFRSMIRLDPGRQITPDSYPSSVVDVYRAAYLDHLMEGGRTLGLSVDEGRRLTDLLDADTVVVVLALRDASSSTWVIQLYDRHADTLVLDARVSAEATTDAVVESLIFELSDVVACLDPLEPLDPIAPSDVGHAYVGAGAVMGTFARDPVDEALLHFGPSFAAEWAPHEAVSLRASSQLLFSGRDADGDLLATIDTWRLGLSPVVYGRWERVRLGFGAGLELARSTEVLATESYWCRVSGGDPIVFDAERSCDASDVTRQAATLYFGGTTHIETSVQVIDPVWLQFELQAAFFLLPAHERALDVPLTFAVRTAYRF